MQLDGRRDQLVGKVQERYGIARDQAARDVDNWLNNTAAQLLRPSAV